MHQKRFWDDKHNIPALFRSLRDTAIGATLLFGAYSGVLAQTSANPPLYSPVLLGSTYSQATNGFSVPIQVRPIGGVASIQTLKMFGHDFSRTRFGSGRYFLTTEGTVRTGDTLAAYDESGLVRTVLNAPAENLTFWRANWSLDGTRIAWCGGRYNPADPEGDLLESGIYMGDVSLDAFGNPAALSNVRLLVSDSRVNRNSSFVSWTGDQQYVIYSVYTGTANTIYRVRVNATSVGTPERINIGNLPSNATFSTPKASPVPGDSRISFVAYVHSYEIWTVNVPTTYNPATDILSAKQVTKSGSIYQFGLAYYDWSPDATAFAFTQYTPSYPRVMRVPSAGGSSSTLLSGNKAGYTIGLWRN